MSEVIWALIGFAVATVAYGKVGDALQFIKDLFKKKED